MKRLAVVPRSSIPMGGRTLRIGDQGRDVRELQSALKTFGFYRWSVDGQYGILTEEAIISLQLALGLRPDGRAGEAIFRILRGLEEPLWALYRLEPGEDLQKVASLFGIQQRAMRVPPSANPIVYGLPLLIPFRNLWIWEREWWPEAGASEVLMNAGEESQDGGSALPRQIVMDGKALLEKKDANHRLPKGIIDCRGISLEDLRHIVKRLSRNEERPWIWVEEQALTIPGTMRFLGIEQKRELVKGVIVDINPKTSLSVGVPVFRIPSMLSVDLRAVLREKGEERRISAKEARHRILLADGVPERHGRYNWAVWRRRHENDGYSITSSDLITMETVYREIVKRGHAGLVVTGIEAPTRRLLRAREKFFAVRRDMNEQSLTYI